MEEFPRSSRYLTSHTSEFNYLYDSFVNYCFGMLLVDLLPTVQYAATYFILPLSFEPPQLRQSGE